MFERVKVFFFTTESRSRCPGPSRTCPTLPFPANIHSLIKKRNRQKVRRHLNISPTSLYKSKVINLLQKQNRSPAAGFTPVQPREHSVMLVCDPVHPEEDAGHVEVRALCRPVVHTRPISYFALCMQAKSHHNRKGMF